MMLSNDHLLSSYSTIKSKEKLQKLLATLGLGSRRKIEQWIQANRITINGKNAQLGARINSKDTLTLDGRLIHLPPSNQIDSLPKLLLYYKPAGEICSAEDPQGRRTVFQSLPSIRPQRWVMIGRLDLNTAGLLLFTTDGLLSHRLLHPRYEIEREYAVRVHGHTDPAMIRQLKEGVLLEGKITRFSNIEAKAGASGSNRWYYVILKEGRQREVRRLWATQGVTVSRLIRIRFGPIRLATTLKPGQFTWLEAKLINQLQRCVGL